LSYGTGASLATAYSCYIVPSPASTLLCSVRAGRRGALAHHRRLVAASAVTGGTDAMRWRRQRWCRTDRTGAANACSARSPAAAFCLLRWRVRCYAPPGGTSGRGWLLCASERFGPARRTTNCAANHDAAASVAGLPMVLPRRGGAVACLGSLLPPRRSLQHSQTFTGPPLERRTALRFPHVPYRPAGRYRRGITVLFFSVP
jgi:hypothetical protein